MSNNILQLIENKNLIIKEDKIFCAIIGENPSKNARSPVLWNKAFKKFHKKCEMCSKPNIVKTTTDRQMDPKGQVTSPLLCPKE